MSNQANDTPNEAKPQRGYDLCVVTWNIRHGLGMDGRVNLSRIADELRVLDADIVCLQEVESLSPRTRMTAQAAEVARALHMNVYFAPNWSVGPVWHFGNAILARWNIHSTWNNRLPSSSEPRGIAQISVKIGEIDICVLCTHWGLYEKDRLAQAKATVGASRSESDRLTILCGDLNAGPASEEVRMLGGRGRLTSTGDECGPTYPSDNPKAKIDYIFVSRQFEAESAVSPTTTASDHKPLMARLKIP